MKRATEVKWGLIFVGVLLLWMALERLAGLHGPRIEQHATWTSLFAIPAIVVYVLALREKRDRDLGGTMTFGQGFVSGFVVTVVVTVLSPVSQWLIHTVITPDFFANAIEASDRLGMSSRAEAEAYFNLGNYIRVGVMGTLAMGVATSAVVAFFVRRTDTRETGAG
ncbi:MAG: DUF4199 domain-containing protein [Gemmatimonadota bacterium]